MTPETLNILYLAGAAVVGWWLRHSGTIAPSAPSAPPAPIGGPFLQSHPMFQQAAQALASLMSAVINPAATPAPAGGPAAPNVAAPLTLAEIESLLVSVLKQSQAPQSPPAAAPASQPAK